MDDLIYLGVRPAFGALIVLVKKKGDGPQLVKGLRLDQNDATHLLRQLRDFAECP